MCHRGPSKLTFEEMSTLLTQIEGVLNPRPLTSLPSNSDFRQFAGLHTGPIFNQWSTGRATPESCYVNNVFSIKINLVSNLNVIHVKIVR